MKRSLTPESARSMAWFTLLRLCLILTPLLTGAAASPNPRSIPVTLPGNPGNIFLLGQAIRVEWPDSLPAGNDQWRLLDDRLEVLQSGIRPDPVESNIPEPLVLEDLPVGWYRIEFGSIQSPAHSWTTAAVLQPLRAPVPLHSPVGVDAAISWFARDDVVRQEEHASLASLAGANWVRDRLRWRDVQPEPGPLKSDRTTYDTAAQVQARHGLQVLQVFHDSPPWTHVARPVTSSFAPDLRDVHQFAKSLAHRFQGLVSAWEPWNEANVPNFGGHTVDQMCSWQKAAWLGFKAGDSRLIVGWNPTAAVPTPAHTHGILANETWPYFDTYNIHTYDWAHSYRDLWAPAREAASGRPLWITEADRGTLHLKDPPWFDLDPRLERLKAQWIAQSYASSLFAGATRHFHFILGHYHEPQGVQFGLLRLDLTPRPAYVALAAAGRCLAGATILGHWQPEPDVHVYAFQAQPDGEPHDVLVVYAERDVDWDARGVFTSTWQLPAHIQIRGIFDYLGRPLGTSFPRPLTSAPIFIFLPHGQAARLPLTPPPPLAPPRAGEASPIVLQLVQPRSTIVAIQDLPWSEGHAYAMEQGTTQELALHAYNFSDQPVMADLEVLDQPSGWHIAWSRTRFQIDPGERVVLTGSLRMDGDADTRDGWIKLRAATGTHGNAALAFRFVLQPSQLQSVHP
jgi:hypothetical protein